MAQVSIIPIVNFSDLQEGNLYQVYSKLFDTTNRKWLVSKDCTGLNRDIVYWQFADKGARRILKGTIVELFRSNIMPPVMAMWKHEFDNKDYTIHLISLSHE